MRWKNGCPVWKFLLPIILLIALCPAAVAADDAPIWQETGIHLTDTFSLCFDATHPNVLLTLDGPLGQRSGTVAYNWATGEKSAVQSRTFEACSEQTGWLFARNPDGTAFQFGLDAPSGTTIAHFPTDLAADGSSLLYSLSPPDYGAYPAQTLVNPGHLWVSMDSGATWTEQGSQFGGRIRAIAVVERDARSVYALVEERVLDTETSVRLTLFSADAGAMWEQRSVQQIGLSGFTDWPSSGIAAVHGQSAPTTALTFSTRPGYPGSGVHSDVSLSTDGGRTFQLIGLRGLGLGVDLVATTAGILRLNLRGVPGASDTPYLYSVTSDGGATWQPLALPYTPEPDADSVVRIEVSPTSPSLVFLTSRRPHDIYVARDGGLTWQKLAEYRGNVHISPYAPLTMIGFTDGALSSLDLSGLTG